MKAGDLRHRVSIQQDQSTQDPVSGDMTQEWIEVGKAWAAIEPLSAREFIAAQASQSKVTTRITIRYRAGIDHTMRLVHNGRIYNIEGTLADKDSGLEYLTLPCSEGVNEG